MAARWTQTGCCCEFFELLLLGHMPHAAPLRFFSVATASSLSLPPNQSTRWDFGETASAVLRMSAIGTKRTFLVYRTCPKADMTYSAFGGKADVARSSYSTGSLVLGEMSAYSFKAETRLPTSSIFAVVPIRPGRSM